MAYVTKTDYLVFDGINLEVELPDDDNTLQKVERFIDEVERFFFRTIKRYGFVMSNVNDSNMAELKEAIMYQIRHFLKYGRDGLLDADAYDCLHSVGLVNPIRY